MDGERFAGMARRYSAAVGRRAVVRALAGLAGIGAVAATGAGDAAARKRRKRRCGKGRFRLAGRCPRGCTAACTAAGGGCSAPIAGPSGLSFCVPLIPTLCDGAACAAHAGCGKDELCAFTFCGPNGAAVGRCEPLL